jgi:hypothetical protein
MIRHVLGGNDKNAYSEKMLPRVWIKSKEEPLRLSSFAIALIRRE